MYEEGEHWVENMHNEHCRLSEKEEQAQYDDDQVEVGKA